jgi:hypothetical protein
MEQTTGQRQKRITRFRGDSEIFRFVILIKEDTLTTYAAGQTKLRAFRFDRVKVIHMDLRREGFL